MTFDFFNTVDAANLIVDTLVDEDDGDVGLGDLSLREAIAIANSTETPEIISFSEEFKDQTIPLSSGELVLNGSILIDGDIDQDDKADIEISAAPDSRVLNVQGANVALNGLNISGGGVLSGNGGGIYAQASLDIANSTIGSNSAFGGKGGGIAVFDADLRLINSTVSSNFGASGGGLHIESGQATIENSKFIENNADDGAGIFNDETSELTVLSSQFETNQAENSGGGILNAGTSQINDTTFNQNFGRSIGGGITNNGTLNLSNSRLENNTADLSGGAIANRNGILSVESSTIANNVVDFSGGGIDSSGALDQPVLISNSLISQNSSEEYGGGLSGQFEVTGSAIIGNNSNLFGGGLFGGGRLVNTLVNNNTATINGGGIDAENIEVVSSTISGNTLRDNFFTGAGIDVSGTGQFTNSIFAGSQGGNDVSTTEAGTIQVNGVNLVEDASFTGVSVINADPLLGNVSDNGGSVLSQTLLPGSPAIDAGDNSVVTTDVDQRGTGFPRILDGNGDGNSIVDLGAVEAQSTAISPKVYFTLKKETTLEGVNVNNEDIIFHDGVRSAKYFDGSDLGLGTTRIDAFDVIDDNVILMSFNRSRTIEGLGFVDDSDIVKFTATSLGEDTAGSFERYFDGSDVGLVERDEDIDALTGLANGDILVSTKSNYQLPGIQGERGDLLRFTPTSLGENTSGSWSLYFDSSDTDLKTKNINAITSDADGKLLISTSARFDAQGVKGANDDIFGFTSSTFGEDTSVTLDPRPVFDGSQFGLSSNAIIALDIA